MRIDIYHHFDVVIEVDKKLNQILDAIQALTKQEKIMNQEMQVMADEITALKTVEDSATAMITGMAAQLVTLVQNATDLAQMKADALALAQNLTDNSAPLAAAVAANTAAV